MGLGATNIVACVTASDAIGLVNTALGRGWLAEKPLSLRIKDRFECCEMPIARED